MGPKDWSGCREWYNNFQQEPAIQLKYHSLGLVHHMKGLGIANYFITCASSPLVKFSFADFCKMF